VRAELRTALGSIIAILGTAAAIVTLLLVPLPWRRVIFIFLGATVVVILANVSARTFARYWRGHQTLPPLERVVPWAQRYGIEPARREDLAWIAELESRVYSKDDAIPLHLLQEWYDANPTGFSIIRATDGRMIGHLDILPIRPSTLESFIAGSIVEKDIRGDCLYPPTNRGLIHDLYVESIIVMSDRTRSAGPAVLQVLSSIVPIVDRICDLALLRSVYAIAASRPGERLLQGLGYNRVVTANQRKDGHHLFRAEAANLTAKVQALCGSRYQSSSAPRTEV
jgi:hypothetical protein